MGAVSAAALLDGAVHLNVVHGERIHVETLDLWRRSGGGRGGERRLGERWTRPRKKRPGAAANVTGRHTGKAENPEAGWMRGREDGDDAATMR